MSTNAAGELESIDLVTENPFGSDATTYYWIEVRQVSGAIDANFQVTWYGSECQS